MRKIRKKNLIHKKFDFFLLKHKTHTSKKKGKNTIKKNYWRMQVGGRYSLRNRVNITINRYTPEHPNDPIVDRHVQIQQNNAARRGGRKRARNFQTFHEFEYEEITLMQCLSLQAETCAICLEDHSVIDCVKFGCGHCIGQSCFDEMFIGHSMKEPNEPCKCPLCRNPILKIKRTLISDNEDDYIFDDVMSDTEKEKEKEKENEIQIEIEEISQPPQTVLEKEQEKEKEKENGECDKTSICSLVEKCRQLNLSFLEKFIDKNMSTPVVEQKKNIIYIDVEEEEGLPPAFEEEEEEKDDSESSELLMKKMEFEKNPLFVNITHNINHYIQQKLL